MHDLLSGITSENSDKGNSTCSLPARACRVAAAQLDHRSRRELSW